MADSNAADQEKLLKRLEDRATEAERRLSAIENGNIKAARSPSHRGRALTTAVLLIVGSQGTGASPEVVQTLQSVRQLLSKAKDRQLELEKREATLLKESTQV